MYVTHMSYMCHMCISHVCHIYVLHVTHVSHLCISKELNKNSLLKNASRWPNATYPQQGLDMKACIFIVYVALGYLTQVAKS